ncbi:MAG TPA: ankyrin repeat domain-containing protein [Hanamia sp.]|nr:ankyrin repeat domain-containing protein [Hanamia sp.]
MRIIIKNGADVNAKQMKGVTPLHSAAHNGRNELAKLLIDNGADINAKMDNGHTPLFMAEEKGFKETAELIKQFGGQ